MSDKRIGTHFLYPGPGYGGSCFPKDVKALLSTSKKLGMPLSIIDSVEKVNDKQKIYIIEKIKKHFNGNLKGKTFTLWGCAFKPNTDDVREAPAEAIAVALAKEGCQVNVFDPVALENFEKLMAQYSDIKNSIKYFQDKYEALGMGQTSGVIIVTEWREFKVPDYSELKKRMKDHVIFDARNIYSPTEVEEKKFSYYAIGRNWKKA